MILKIKTIDNAWVYYQIKRKVKVRDLTKEQYKNGMEVQTPDRVEVISDWKSLPKHMEILKESAGHLIVINFEDKERCDEESIIYTNLCAYLLNDEGKTIERIN
jgi:hypothetical protein